MTFERYFRLFSVLLILTGFLSILITGSYPISVMWGILITLLYGYMGDRLAKVLPIPKPIWNTVALLLLSYFIYDSFWGSQDLIGNGIRFVVYLQIVKLLSPKTPRDEMQIYLLSFLHLLASTVVSTDVSFALPFFIYIVLSTWTLTMFTLRNQLSQTTHESRREAVVNNLLKSKSVMTRSFLYLTSVLAVTIIAFTMLIFFSFPRLSMGNFLKRIDSRQKVSGFSENVELGTIGNIKTNNKVVFRVEIPQETLDSIDIEKLYWRATASDHFDGKRWRQSLEGRQAINLDLDSGVYSVSRKGTAQGKRISYRVFMEALDPPMLFGADQILRVTWEKPMIEKFFRRNLSLSEDEYEGLHFAGFTSYISDLTYQAESVLSPETPTSKETKNNYSYYDQSYYLQIPKLDPDVEKLIQSIPLDPNETLYEKAKSIVSFIEKNYRYTLDVQDVGTEDPLRFFFLEKKAGHCEYFSTALAIALRVRGIAAREVLGFRGGEVNPYGGYVAVRQSDAHTWVEMLIPQTEWVRLDPSPLDSTIRFKKPYFQALSQFLDYLRLRWNKYIIEYDLRSQAKILEDFGKYLSRFTSKQQTKEEDVSKPKDRDTSFFPRILILSIFTISIIGIVFALRSRKAAQKNLFVPYLRVLKILDQAGFTKKSSETFQELRLRVEKECGELKSLREFEQFYYEERFGGHSKPIEWNKKIKQLQSELKYRTRISKQTVRKTNIKKAA